MRIIYSFIIIVFSVALCRAQSPNIIPQPASIKMGSGQFVINKQTVLIVQDNEDKKTAQFFNDYLNEYFGFKLNTAESKDKNFIRLTTKKFIKAPEKDAYQMTVNSEGVSIEGDTYSGTFYGIQSLIQLLPVPAKQSKASLSIPQLSIQDEPRFAYRGLHLDVCRNMFPISFIKKYIDYIALHKMNYFHWHLTDDQGWRIEIKKYPELTKVGAWRNGTIIGSFSNTRNDNTRYGGFYTQEEVKEIVRYAADRHITVVPEIEMPGHASAAIAAFPSLSCFPNEPTNLLPYPSLVSQKKGGKNVQENFGIFDDVFCAGKDSTFKFLQDVLDEVIPLFPSKYIHIGGDESPKANWKRCPNCQARIKANNLKDEHELQSYFISRMEKYVNSKGRTIIGWDEILEGGLAPNAVVMSWRGEAGGIAAAKENHHVIMSPTSYCYFDYSQSPSKDSVTFEGYIPLEKVYSYEPVPKILNETQAKYVMGAQANLWTEFIQYPSKVEYMIFPRLCALSEVLWTSPTQKNWSDFEKRLQTQFKRYELWGANYSKAYFDIRATIQPAVGNNGVLVKLETKDKNATLKYRIGEKIQKYTTPILVNKNAVVSGFYYLNNKLINSISIPFQFNKATGKPVTLKELPSPNYTGNGAFTLTDGIINELGFGRSEFLGYGGRDASATIDLGTVQKVNTVTIHALDATDYWIYAPKNVEVFVSADGKEYTKMGSSDAFVKTKGDKGKVTVTFLPTTARYIQVDIKYAGLIPEGKQGAGSKSWLFVDEIEVL